MAKVLLLTSADVQRDRERLARGETPRRDYLGIAEALDAEVYDFGQVLEDTIGKRLVRVIGRGPTHALLAWRRLRREHTAVFSDSEHVGLILGMLLRLRRRRPRHTLLAHHLTPPKKRPFALLGRGGIDLLLLHSEAQRRLATGKLGFAPERVEVVPYQVDTRFWQPREVVEGQDIICSAGLECRDYPTLAEAVDGLPVSVRIGAASNWSRKSDLLEGRPLPANVAAESYDYLQLRDLYARSRFVVVPLIEIDFQAGITLILEAMAMAKAVVVTRTVGQAGAVIGPLWTAGTTAWPPDGPSLETATGIYVLPGDAPAWRSAISFLLAHPKVAAALGRNGRAVVERDYTVEAFAERFASLIRGEPAAKAAPGGDTT
jgi:glycosyltransferase involved in cell wall biosynthesis